MTKTTMTHGPTTDSSWLRAVVDRATANVDAGGGPFAAVVVRDGEPLAYGENRVTRDHDPTAHAEVVALRRACAVVGDFGLPGTVLYSSCEPCPLCAAAALWARVSRVVYAADCNDAARGGFDDSAFHELFREDRATWPMPVEQRPIEGRAAPFDRWLSHPQRVPY
jgi:guanine deaminase